MDPSEEKKRIANEKRMKAVQAWQKKGNQRSNVKAVHHTFVSPVTVNVSDDNSKLNLFNSDDEDDNNELNFDIRPQFEGPSGQHLLEKSSEFSSRFKLDERFKNDDENPIEIRVENEEKTKNFEILESILGYEVSEKYPEGKNLLKKRLIKRFDPEDESASKYIKVDETLEEKPKKKIREKKAVFSEKEKPKEQILTSTDRYIEVSTNLKEILKSASASPFTLTSKFSFNDNQEAGEKIIDDFKTPFSTAKEIPQYENRSKFSERTHDIFKNAKKMFENQKKFTFFTLESEECLKGVEFFKRPKPIEELRVEWNKKKDDLEDLLRRKRKTSQRGYVNKPNASQKNKTFAKNKKF